VDVFLQTERLVLRRFTPDDVDRLVELDNDPEVMRYVNGGRPVARDEIADDVLPAFLAYYERYEGFGFWAAVEKAGLKLVRTFHQAWPHPIEGDQFGDVEYALDRAA
jgi:RimJ/RimL family protein N-acetyltransferase